MDLGLADRVYVVTGGTKGLGRAAAEALVADGARVVVSSRSQDSVDAAVRAPPRTPSPLGSGDVATGVPRIRQRYRLCVRWMPWLRRVTE